MCDSFYPFAMYRFDSVNPFAMYSFDSVNPFAFYLNFSKVIHCYTNI